MSNTTLVNMYINIVSLKNVCFSLIGPGLVHDPLKSCANGDQMANSFRKALVKSMLQYAKPLDGLHCSYKLALLVHRSDGLKYFLFSRFGAGHFIERPAYFFRSLV